MEKVSIILNGEKKSFRKGMSVQELLREFNLPEGGVVVEVNEEVLRRESLTLQLKEGDRVELVRFVGGG